jgi:phage terminase small subunit
MAALTNPKHERFAQELAKGKSQAEAYVEAGYAPSEPNASRLTSNEKVRARVAEIQERGALRAEVTIATLTQDLLRLRDKGEALRDAAGLSVARNSVMDIAKLNGLVIDKAQLDASVQINEIRRTIVRA